MGNYILGFDIGGTKCAVLLADVDNGIRLLDRLCFPTEPQFGCQQTIDRLFQGGRDILERNGAGAGHLLAVGVSCGGPLDSRRGVVLSPPHLPGWDNIPLTAMIEKEFGVPAFLQNDANACALVEWKLGAARGTESMMFLTMGTGFGAGIVAEGRLLLGASDLAGEVGHIRLENDGPVGYGKAGSVEGLCSGAGIADAARLHTKELTEQGRPPAWVRDGLSEAEITAKSIAEYANAGDEDAIEIYRCVGRELGKALAVFLDILNPECVVIGSVFVRSENLLRSSMEEVLAAEALPGALKVCRVVPAQTGEKLGDYASILAACYAMDIDVLPDQPTCKQGVLAHYDRLFVRYPALREIQGSIMKAFLMMRGAYQRDKKLLVCGNGGSAADADHIVGELMKGFYLSRPVDSRFAQELGEEAACLQRALPAIALTQHSALSTAFLNDVDASMVFAQQVFGYGHKGDVLLCITTSGNSKNVLKAAKVAKAMGIRVIGLTGQGGGRLAEYADVLIAVPAKITAEVQEYHLPVYHTLCAMLEQEFFPES